MPDERREFHKICPASHTLLSVNCLYQMNTAERKRVFTKLGRGHQFPSSRYDPAPRRSSDGEDRKRTKNMDHSGSRLRALSHQRGIGVNRSHQTRTKLRRRMAWQRAAQMRRRRRRRPIFSSRPTLRRCHGTPGHFCVFRFVHGHSSGKRSVL